MSNSVGTSVLITHEVGLHARPSVKLTKLAKSFPADVEIALAPDGPWIDAKSIVKVMKLKASKGEVLRFRVTGSNAEADLAELVGLVTREFDE